MNLNIKQYIACKTMLVFLHYTDADSRNNIQCSRKVFSLTELHEKQQLQLNAFCTHLIETCDDESIGYF